MNSLITILQSFFQWLYDSVNSLISFCQSAHSWLIHMISVYKTVETVVVPGPLEAILGLMISFMLIFLVVRLVVNLL